MQRNLRVSDSGFGFASVLAVTLLLSRLALSDLLYANLATAPNAGSGFTIEGSLAPFLSPSVAAENHISGQLTNEGRGSALTRPPGLGDLRNFAIFSNASGLS